MKPEQLEIERLRREVQKQEAERDILKRPQPSSRRKRYEIRLHREASECLAGGMAVQCNALSVSRWDFHAWLNRSPSARSRSDEALGQQVKPSFVASDRTYGARRVWHDLLAEGADCGLHRIERLMRLEALRAQPRRRRLPKDHGDRPMPSVPPNILDRQFEAERPNQKHLDR
jgi:hypothetical protein